MSSLRLTATDLARFLESGTAPIYVLDEDRQIIFCNTSCAQWLGIAPDALIGQQCHYHTPATAALAEQASEESAEGSESLATAVNGLCPPPQVFSGQAQMAVVSAPRPNGNSVHRRGHFLPLSHGDDEGAPVIAVLECDDLPPASSAESTSGGAVEGDADSQAQLHEQVRQFRQQAAGKFALDRLIGNHPRIVRARAQIESAAQSGATVLIVGDVGTGKDHAAKAVHYRQPAPGLLVPLDCAVLETNTLLSSLRTLIARRANRASGSTLLLENVAAMPAAVQSELLEAIRRGSLQMRITATTGVPLAELVVEETFLGELAYALSTIVIEMPRLTERLEDLPVLAQAMLEQLNAKSLRQVAGLAPEALDQLAAYPWPGNLDELSEMVRQLHEKSQSAEIAPRDLPKTIHWGAEAAGHHSRGDEAIVLEEFLGRVEKELISRAMRRAKGNKSKAAKLLGLTRPRLYRRLVQLGLEGGE